MALSPNPRSRWVAATKRSGAGVPGPETITGLRLWLKADSLSLADNDAVVTWADSSGNANDGTGVNGPIYKVNIVNGKPVVRYNGVDERFTLPDALFSGMTQGEVFAVLKVDNDPPAALEQSGLWNFGSAAQMGHYPFTDSSVYEAFGTSSRKATGNPTDSLASFHLLNIWSVASDWVMNVNGTQHFSDASNGVGFPAAGITLGVSSGTAFFDGDMAEVCLYETKLSAGDRTIVKTYIASKYGLTIA